MTTLQIKDGTVEIADDAFDGNSCVTVIFPETVTRIGARAFADCMNLTTICLPHSMLNGMLGPNAFSGCSSLKSVTFAPFRQPGAADTVVLAAKGQHIPQCCFMGCTSLASVDLPEGILSIGSRAFEACSMLQTIALPNTCQSISIDAFFKCTNLWHVSLYIQNERILLCVNMDKRAYYAPNQAALLRAGNGTVHRAGTRGDSVPQRGGIGALVQHPAANSLGLQLHKSDFDGISKDQKCELWSAGTAPVLPGGIGRPGRLVARFIKDRSAIGIVTADGVIAGVVYTVISWRGDKDEQQRLILNERLQFWVKSQTNQVISVKPAVDARGITFPLMGIGVLPIVLKPPQLKSNLPKLFLGPIHKLWAVALWDQTVADVYTPTIVGWYTHSTNPHTTHFQLPFELWNLVLEALYGLTIGVKIRALENAVYN